MAKHSWFGKGKQKKDETPKTMPDMTESFDFGDEMPPLDMFSGEEAAADDFAALLQPEDAMSADAPEQSVAADDDFFGGDDVVPMQDAFESAPAEDFLQADENVQEDAFAGDFFATDDAQGAEEDAFAGDFFATDDAQSAQGDSLTSEFFAIGDEEGAHGDAFVSDDLFVADDAQGDAFATDDPVVTDDAFATDDAFTDDFVAPEAAQDVPSDSPVEDFFAVDEAQTATDEDAESDFIAPAEDSLVEADTQSAPDLAEFDEFFEQTEPLRAQEEPEPEAVEVSAPVEEIPFDIAVPEEPAQPETLQEEVEQPAPVQEEQPTRKYKPVFTAPVPSALDELRQGLVKPASPIPAVAATQIPLVITAAEAAAAEAAAQERAARERAEAAQAAALAQQQAEEAAARAAAEAEAQAQRMAQEEAARQAAEAATQQWELPTEQPAPEVVEEATKQWDVPTEPEQKAVPFDYDAPFAPQEPAADALAWDAPLDETAATLDFDAPIAQDAFSMQPQDAQFEGGEFESFDNVNTFDPNAPQDGQLADGGFESFDNFDPNAPQDDQFADGGFESFDSFDPNAPQDNQFAQGGFDDFDPNAPQDEQLADGGFESFDSFDNFDTGAPQDEQFAAGGFEDFDNFDAPQEPVETDGDALFDDALQQDSDTFDMAQPDVDDFDGFGADATEDMDFDAPVNPFATPEWTGDGMDETTSIPYEATHKTSKGKGKSAGGGFGGNKNLPLWIALGVIVLAIIGIVIYLFASGTIGGGAPSVSTPPVVSTSVSEPSSVSVAAEPEPAVEPIPRDEWYMTLTNKEHPLSADFTVTTANTTGGIPVDARIVDALNQMVADGNATGLNLVVTSGYRTYARQQTNYNYQVNQLVAQGLSQADAEKQAALITAPPGTSEHNLGLSADIQSRSSQDYSDTYDQTDEAKWLLENAANYGFILRYPKDGESITGFSYEPWHYRYVGVDQAQKIKASGLTLEEYLAQDAPTGLPDASSSTTADDASSSDSSTATPAA